MMSRICVGFFHHKVMTMFFSEIVRFYSRVANPGWWNRSRILLPDLSLEPKKQIPILDTGSLWKLCQDHLLAMMMRSLASFQAFIISAYLWNFYFLGFVKPVHRGILKIGWYWMIKKHPGEPELSKFSFHSAPWKARSWIRPGNASKRICLKIMMIRAHKAFRPFPLKARSSRMISAWLSWDSFPTSILRHVRRRVNGWWPWTYWRRCRPFLRHLGWAPNLICYTLYNF